MFQLRYIDKINKKYNTDFKTVLEYADYLNVMNINYNDLNTDDVFMFYIGENEDQYDIIWCCKALKEFNLSDIEKEFYKDPITKDMHDENPDSVLASDFISWLIDEEYVELIDKNIKRFHLGEFSFSPSF